MLRLLTPLLLLPAGCVTPASDDPAPAATAALRAPDGRVVARTRVTSMSDGAHVVLEAQGLPSGRYGAHLHMTGRCEGPAFASAGGHWNPTARQHGTQNPQGHHLGDLPNLEVGADGIGRIEFHVAGATLRDGARAILDADGTAVVIHAAADDHRTDPSGNSGDRIACGVLG